MTDVLVKLDLGEEDWLTARIAEFGGKTILLSHHQLFSAFAQIGPAAADGSFTAYNPNLDASFQRFAAAGGNKIAAWFWGHEHTLTLYGPHRGLNKGRCVGHGAIPVLTAPDPNDPRSHIVDPPPVDPVSLAVDDDVYMHDFVILNLAADGSATADYYQENSGNTPMWSEPL
ncbi:hypothetical protein [Acidisphaera sp. S103]|uniref:hypothetical protein n=1 Tax=Acidisphaera sp. S103 TaxID=1747223 RepID=UPI00131CDC85|nr:hypothetical protein [Acidisphaera sp. S103]